MTTELGHANGKQTLDGLWALHARNLAALNEIVKVSIEQVQSLVIQSGSVVAETNRQFAVALWRGIPLAADLESSFGTAQRAIDASFAHTLAITELASKAQLESLSVLRRSTIDCLKSLRLQPQGARRAVDERNHTHPV